MHVNNEKKGYMYFGIVHLINVYAETDENEKY